MNARLIAFGEIEIGEKRYDCDVVIDGGSGVKLVALPTEEACRLLRDLKPRNAYAIRHTTC